MSISIWSKHLHNIFIIILRIIYLKIISFYNTGILVNF
uniref:Uncharacterized protein n=1 Tax=Podoviridae sp. ct8Lf7 TaxID=2827723 RepID=A0A8S5S0Q2_9CAUD|nr:MAG TPA: hypothetical protein [Podoviridae sp. ct8Lf7]